MSRTAMLAAWVLMSSVAAAATAPTPQSLVDNALPALGFRPEAHVVSAEVIGGTLTVDFTTATADGLTDSSLESLTDAVRHAWQADSRISNTRLTSGGHLLAESLPPVPLVLPGPPEKAVVGTGALSGKKIAISPGHGWYYNGSSWVLQRGYWQGIVEDFLNPEMIQYVENLLANNGATVITCREMDKSYGDARSTFTFAGLTRPAPSKPWWQMASLYYTMRSGAPSSVYDNGRDTDYNRDIAARPLFANWKGADIMISLHNNGGGGTGTETLYDNANASAAGSQSLATKVQARIISELRAHYSSSWYDRKAQGFAGSYGENRIAACPAIIIETAFMDTPTPDNAALHDEKYKMLVAKAIYEGICDYFKVTPTWNTSVAAPSGSWSAKALAKQWSLSLASPINAAPSTADGWVYAGTDAGAIHAVAGTTASGYTPGRQIWRYPASGGIGAAILARPTVYGDTVFAIAKNGRMVAVNRYTGALRWALTLPNSGNVLASPAATADGLLIIGSDNGRLYSYRQDNGALVRTFPQSFGAINAQVAVPDSGHVWVTSADGRVRCISGDLSTVLWEVNTGTSVNSAPYVLTNNNSVYFANEARTVYALNASNGSPATGWPASGGTFGVNIGTSVWADGTSGIVAFGLDNHTVSAVATGAPFVPADFPLRPFGVKEFTSSPVAYKGTLYIGGTDGRFYALHRADGVTDPGTGWRAFDASSEPVPGQFVAAPCLTGTGSSDVVVAGNTNGTLYAFPL